jgi:ribonuclease P protein component
MLKKVNRGLGRKDFENSREKGKLIHGSYFSVSLVDESDNKGSPVQVGFVISKKISKWAVDRNRIKRLIAEVIKKDVEQHKNLKLKHQKIIILVRKNILEAKVEDIEKCWGNVYEKISS